VTELRLRTDYSGRGTGDERIDVRAEGRSYGMGGNQAVAFDATVARSGNHVTSVWSFPYRGAANSAGRVSVWLRRSMQRLAEVSRGEVPD